MNQNEKNKLIGLADIWLQTSKDEYNYFRRQSKESCFVSADVIVAREVSKSLKRCAESLKKALN